MKKLICLFLIATLLLSNSSFARKTRSDKGGTHNHTTSSYYVESISGNNEYVGGVLIVSIVSLTIIIIWAKINAKRQAKIAEEEAKQTQEKIDNYLISIKEEFKKEDINVKNWADVESQAHYKGLSWITSKGQQALAQGRRLNEMVVKYGEDKGNKIYNKQFYLGMTKEELKDSTGEPNKIETDILKTKTKETWIYGNKSSGDVFVFENDILTRFKDR